MVGESFSEIFFGNAVMLGLPAVTASAADVQALQERIERNPGIEVSVDLEAMRAACADLSISVHLPDAARDALMTGRWDGLSLLLQDYDAVRASAARLPYLNEFRARR